MSLPAIIAVLICALAGAAERSPDAQISAAMEWAFPLNPPSTAAAAPVDMTAPLHVAGSSRTYRRQDYADMLGAPDWWPHDHPAMPQIVARGRKPAWACAFCHLPNGQGRPENAALAGLPAEYIIDQVEAFRSGERTSGRPEMAKYMPVEARNVSDADLKLAADYFASMPYKPWTRVVETATVPKTRIEHFMLVPIAGAGREPIGERIIETARNLERTELRDARSGFIAYVPPGSIDRGRSLATTGDGRVQPCVACHGADLRGAGIIPPLAARPPTYLVRQLIQFQTGGRRNAASLPMQQESSKLTLGDMIAVAAYAASRAP